MIGRIIPSLSPVRPLGWLTAAVVVVSVLITLGLSGDTASAVVPEDVLRYDEGVNLIEARTPEPGYVTAETITYFTDCAPGQTGGSCGGPPGRWTKGSLPVAFCTSQAGRPAQVSPELFRSAVQGAADMWNDLDVAMGVRYSGDCSASTWTFGNGVNEIGFDDERDLVRGSVAAVARGSWRNLPSYATVQSREFVEFDIIIGSELKVTDACFRSVVAHEIGHTLGLGHSDSRLDLMYGSFNPNDPSSCKSVATAAESDRLVELYGANRPPRLSLTAPRSAFPLRRVEMVATAVDPDDDPVSYRWTQLSGPPVALRSQGSSAWFSVPEAEGASLTFRVEASDRYLHRSHRDVTVSVTGAPSADLALEGTPSLSSFLSGSGSGMLTWSGMSNATSYRFCAGSTCQSLIEPSARISWDTVLGAGGSPDERRVFVSGERLTSLAACNDSGCTDAGTGPFAGGLRWLAWQMDYDFLGMAYDVPGTGTRFTIGGVVNVDGPPRRFTIYSGTLNEPLQTVVKSCGRLAAGEMCMGLRMPHESGHGTFLTIVSERTGTPMTEHRIRLR